MQINILEAKNRLSELIRVAHSGEDVVIANRGRPVARLVALGVGAEAPMGSADAILDWVETHPVPESVRRTEAEIDHAIAAERRGWD
jgi:prevent-host-death family protein